MPRFFLCALVASALLLATAGPTQAQPQRDSTRTLRLGALIQVVGHASGASSARGEGFSIANARLSAQGQAAPRLSYKLEGDLSDEVALTDARVGYGLLPALSLTAGRFKAPFSYGALISSAQTDFVRQPRAVTALRLGRRVGVAAAYRPPAGGLTLHAGVFNGAAGARAADGSPLDEHLLLYVARVAWGAAGEGGPVTAGVNAAYDASAEGAGLRPGLRYGADVHAERGGAFVTAEALARLDAPPGTASAGAYLTAGHAVAEVHLLRARLDYLDEDAPAAADAPTLLGAGYTFRPGSPLRLEVDYLLPLASPALADSAVLVMVQIDL